MHGRWFLGVLAVGGALSISACGSANSHADARAASSGVPAPASAGQSNDDASKNPARVLRDVSAAIRSAHSFVMEGSLTVAGKRTALRLVYQSPTSLEFDLASDGADASMIVLPDIGYIRANEAFWTAEGAGARGALLADRWAPVPVANTRALSSSLGKLSPSVLSRCILEGNGRLTMAGTTSVHGQPAIQIRSVADAPGTSSYLLAVASSGPAYPLRITSTGAGRPGGRIDVCNDGTGGGDIHGGFTLSDFGHVPPIEPPTNATTAPA